MYFFLHWKAAYIQPNEVKVSSQRWPRSDWMGNKESFTGFLFLFLDAITENEGRSPTPFVGGVSEY